MKRFSKFACAAGLAALIPMAAVAGPMGLGTPELRSSSVEPAHYTGRHHHHRHYGYYRRAPAYYRPYYGAYYVAPRYYYPAYDYGYYAPYGWLGAGPWGW